MKSTVKFTNFNEFNQFSRKNSHCLGVSSAPEMTYQIQALFKDFKDMYESCIRQSTSPDKMQSMCLSNAPCYPTGVPEEEIGVFLP